MDDLIFLRVPDDPMGGSYFMEGPLGGPMDMFNTKSAKDAYNTRSFSLTSSSPPFPSSSPPMMIPESFGREGKDHHHQSPSKVNGIFSKQRWQPTSVGPFLITRSPSFQVFPLTRVFWANVVLLLPQSVFKYRHRGFCILLREFQPGQRYANIWWQQKPSHPISKFSPTFPTRLWNS